MPPPRISNGLLAQLRSLALSSPTRPSAISHPPIRSHPLDLSLRSLRLFSNTVRTSNWLLPKTRASRKTFLGRPQVNTGGSTRGTTVVWGTYGLRLRSHDQRVSSKQFGIAVEAIKRRLRGMMFRLYPRVVTNVAVYTKGNESRMGKGKGGFDFWCARVPHGRVVLEIAGDVHEQVVKDALRLGGNKLPGQWEFVKAGDPPVVGMTRLRWATKEELFRPVRKEPLHPLHLLPDGRRAGDVLDAGNSVPEFGSATPNSPSAVA